MGNPVLASALPIILAVANSLAAQEPRRQSPDEIRTRVSGTALETRLFVTIESGQTFEGELAERRDDAFAIWLDDEETRERMGLRSGRLKRWIRYDEVLTLRGAAPGVALSGKGLEFRVRIGDTVRVRTTDGATVRGKIQDFDGEALYVDGRRFNLEEGGVEQIELRIDDSLGNGMLIGAVAGVGFVALACTGGCDSEIALIGGAFYGGVGAGLGALFDALNHEHRVIYSHSRPGTRWSVVPLLGRDKNGILFSLSF